jgi:hypothetical protein
MSTIPVHCRLQPEELAIVDSVAHNYHVNRAQVFRWAILQYIHEDLDVPSARI